MRAQEVLHSQPDVLTDLPNPLQWLALGVFK
jgi:hypothetical protein